MTWSIEQVVAIAPTPARFAAADALAVPSRWVALGADEQALWGRCRGSGREPYDTMVDHAHVAWRCSCPSRSQPCKHALALLVMWVRGQVPDGARTARRARVGGRATPRAGRPRPAAPCDAERRRHADDAEPAGAAPSTSTASATSASSASSAGLVELDRWLDDRVRTGLADPALARYATWDELAARLVDARAGALANRVRRLAGVVGARPDWHEIVLAELGVLHLLARAGRRVPELPGSLADAVATACGWQVRQADVLAGVPDTDTWVVAGRSDTREDRIEVRRTWLRGRASGRWAMVLSFAAYRQSLDTSLAVGDGVHRRPAPLPGVVVARPRRRPPRRRAGRRRSPRRPPPSPRRAPPSARRSPPSRGSTASRSPSPPRRRSPTAAGCSPTPPGRSALAPEAAGLATLLAASARRAGRRHGRVDRRRCRAAHRAPRPTARSTSVRAPTSRS